MKLHKKYFLIITFIFQNSFAADTCASKAGVSLPPSLLQSMKFFESSAQRLQFTAEKLSANGTSSGMRYPVKTGDILETKTGEKIILRYFMPIEAKIILDSNSKIEILNLPLEKCGSSIRLLKGKLTSDGDHQNFLKNECSADTVTDAAEVFCTGTKYSVDLSEAIAEASGEPVQTVNYSVESGSIRIKLKKIKISKLTKYKKTKNNSDDSAEDSFELVARQKAKVKVNNKTKLADVEVIEP